ncbi:MAG: LysM peptidoglycan-binding domain-containing protein, partial [Bdellovibrionaceae bacterium]|nr:LysM peptidoglycan-binding domain-containing protein [Pseudobdellovibrionaceae bacterium]
MKKQLIIFLATIAMIVSHTGCTSSDTQAEGGEQIATEGGDTANAESAPVEGDTAASTDLGSPETVSENSLTDPNAHPADQNTAQVTDAPATAAPDQNSQAALTDPNAQTQPAPTESLATNEAKPSDTPAPVETVPHETLPPATVTETAPPPAPVEATPVVKAEYKKMETTPWPVGGKMMNTVYFARPGDNFNSVAEKIYGDKKRAKDLKKANTGIAKRSLRPGDKIYYNSPNRPDDSSKIITYYEDKGMQAQTYTTKEGDNLRTLAKEFLGFKDGWKEVWASNSFESNKKLDPGVEIKYWKDEAPSAGSLAQNTPTENHSASGTLPPPPDMANSQPPPPPPPA